MRLEILISLFRDKCRVTPRPTLVVGLILAALSVSVSICPADGRDGLAGHYAAEERAFQAAVARVAASVVRLETVGGLERAEGLVFGNGPSTGLVVDNQGHIVSSAFNFIRKPDSILVQLADGTRKAARLVATDHSRKLVLLKIEIDDKTALSVPAFAEKKTIRSGQWAIAVGRIFPGNRPNIAVGIISAINRIWGKAIQSDAAVSPNNYGGPLIDIHGRVMGVLVPLSPDGDAQTAGLEWYDSGIGFAIPAADVLQSVERMKKSKDLYGGFLGVGFKHPNPSMAEPLVGGCAPGSPAQKAGLKAGDRIVLADGKKINRAADLREAVGQRYAGEKIAITAIRDGREFKAEIELGTPPQPKKRPPKRQPTEKPVQ